MRYQDATFVSRSGDAFAAVIDPEWCIWGPIGGYLAAIALRSVGLITSAGYRPVTLSCQFIAKGEPGPVDIVVEPLKTGGSSFFNVQVRQGGTLLLQAQVVTTAKIAGPDRIEAQMPVVPRREGLECFADQLERYGHKAIGFWANADGRQVDFRAPGDPDPRGCRTECWLRFLDWLPTADPFVDGGRAVMLIDTHLWRAYNRGQSVMPEHVAPSLDLSVWFHEAAPDADWLLCEARTDVARQALLHGTARVWTDDGRLVASGGGQCLFVSVKR